MGIARRRDLLRESGALDEGDGFAIEVTPICRSEAVAVVDQHRFDGSEAHGPQHVGGRGARFTFQRAGRRG